MAGVTVMIAICAAGIVFLVYAFAALCKENRRGACRVVQTLRHADDQLHMPIIIGDRKVISVEARARGQHSFGVGERRAIKVER